jgi:hypothetical protein
VRRVRKMKITVLIFLMSCALTCTATEQIKCDQVWRHVGHIVQVESPVWATPQLPEDGFIEGFSINILKRENGELFHPKTLEESVCALDIMLDNKTRDALRSGLKDYLSSPSFGSVEESFDKVWGSINNRLDNLYMDSGMASGLGINLILGRMEDQFGIKLYGGAENYGALQNKAMKDEIYDPHSVFLWVWVTYMEYIGAREFESESFVDYLRKQSIEGREWIKGPLKS